MLSDSFSPGNKNGCSGLQVFFKSGDRRFATCLRHFIASYATVAVEKSKQDFPFNVAMITNELVQNAIQYSREKTMGRVLVEFQANKAVVITESEPQESHLKNLEEILLKIKNSGKDFYLSQIQNPDKAKLGLVRIACDFQCGLEISKKGTTLMVEANYFF